MRAILERALFIALTFTALSACTTAQQIRRPNGDIEYLIGCGAGTGWNVCYARANALAPRDSTLWRKDAGFNQNELRIGCPAERP